MKRSLMEYSEPEKFRELSETYKGWYLTEICERDDCFGLCCYFVITDSGNFDYIQEMWNKDSQINSKGKEVIESILTIEL